MNIEDPWKTSEAESQPLNILGTGGNDQLNKLKQSVQEAIHSNKKWGPVYQLLEMEYPENSEFAELISKLNVNDKSITGVPLITYCIAFDHVSYLEVLISSKLHSKDGLDLNMTDDFNHWTPLMWCCYLDRASCVRELMRFSEKLDLFYSTTTGQSAQSLLVAGSAVYSFMDIHQVFTAAPKDIPDMYKEPGFNSGIDPTMDELNLQTADMRLHDEEDEDTAYFQPQSERSVNAQPDIPLDSEFNYKILEPRQYISFTSIDIDALGALASKLPDKYPHKPYVAAALTFQCIRYAHHKRHNRTMIESIYNSCFQNILALDKKQDILKQSYSLGYMNFLYYYLYRDEMIFNAYPHVLQNIIDSMISLISSLSESINTRLEPLLHSAILEYTTISEIKETLYKNDWNFFKKRKLNRMKHDSYDEILQHLYPPPVKEQMKPSPVKIVQIFGALTYVFELHDIHPVLLQQCLSLSTKWLSISLFNDLMQSKQLLSRTHALQIRLNLSSLEDWVKNHNFTVEKPKLIDDFMWQRFPLTLVQDVGSINFSKPSQLLQNVLFYRPVKKEPCTDESNSLFFYQSFAQIWQYHLEPTFQLLQWLQIATSLNADDESLDNTLERMNRLNVTQLYKSLDRYRYEVDEPKSKMKKLLKQRVKALKEQQSIIFGERSQVFITLPTLQELFTLYEECDSSYRFLPILPMEVQDEVDEIHDQIKEDDVMTSSSSAVQFDTLDEPKPAAHTVWSSNELQENPW